MKFEEQRLQLQKPSPLYFYICDVCGYVRYLTSLHTLMSVLAQVLSRCVHFDQRVPLIRQ